MEQLNKDETHLGPPDGIVPEVQTTSVVEVSLEDSRDFAVSPSLLDPNLKVQQAVQTNSPSGTQFQLNGQPISDDMSPRDQAFEAGTRTEKSNFTHIDGDEEEPPVPSSFDRASDPAGVYRSRTAAYQRDGEAGARKMHKFHLYETTSRFYLIGADVLDSQYSVLKIDRTAPPGQLSIFEDDVTYDKRGMTQLLNTIDDGNKASGGMKMKCSTWGLLGFIRFTEAYYMLLITKRQQVAMIGGHYIYQIEGTELVPLTTGSSTRFARDRNPEEARFLGILNNLDLSRSFYFSYSYNITRTLQDNIILERRAAQEGRPHPNRHYNDMFVWNSFLLSPAVDVLQNIYDWCLPIIHGFIDQSSLDIFGRCVYVTVIARRSRFFAGARFLKRGANDLGYVANDVETEQIVSEMLTTSFHAPGPKLYSNPNYTSYVQHRGSIPLYWTQDNSGVTPKPDIDLNLLDPFYQPAALHFDNLFERYSQPVIVLNLIKARERKERESKLGKEYQSAIRYLNQYLPEDKNIIYKAFDMSRASKTRGQDVIGTLEIMAEEIITETGFFHNGDAQTETKLQNGVARTNCIDCLDRTNAAQFVIGKRALGRQLHALGVIAGNGLDYDTDAVNIFTHMFHDHGDTIAIQYGGSHLVNTMATYRKIDHWQSQSRDMVESFKRYYHNSFLDAQRQEAYNLFLGNYIYAQGQPMLWELTTDYYLHHVDPKILTKRRRRDYQKWYTPEFLEPRTMPSPIPSSSQELSSKGLSHYDDYWLEYYRPLTLSSLKMIYAYKMNSTARYLPDKSSETGTKYDFSPFRPRRNTNDNLDSPGKSKAHRKGVTIVDPHSDADGKRSDLQPPITTTQHSILRDPHPDNERKASAPAVLSSSTSQTFNQADKTLMTQWTLNQFYTNSLNPSITTAEAEEYARYIAHPVTIPLVVNSATDAHSETTTTEMDAHPDFVEYVNSIASPLTLYPTYTDRVRGVQKGGKTWEVNEHDIRDYEEFAKVREDPLTVGEEDGGKKRYKAYKQWLKGKSLFKQSKVDPEWRP
ncbi:MAG: phosphatidylinositol-3,5-bisphosphate 5-phosphatase [Bogoriella megaspora]|nr:MAG: phosphatidylinositol-3,5-bisphosphate 5-phosphatase [Bogoriella megaspora]